MNARKVTIRRVQAVITARLEARRPLMKVVVGDAVWLGQLSPLPCPEVWFPEFSIMSLSMYAVPPPAEATLSKKYKTQGRVHRKTMLGPLQLMMHRRFSSPSVTSLH